MENTYCILMVMAIILAFVVFVHVPLIKDYKIMLEIIRDKKVAKLEESIGDFKKDLDKVSDDFNKKYNINKKSYTFLKVVDKFPGNIEKDSELIRKLKYKIKAHNFMSNEFCQDKNNVADKILELIEELDINYYKFELTNEDNDLFLVKILCVESNSVALLNRNYSLDNILVSVKDEFEYFKDDKEIIDLLLIRS